MSDGRVAELLRDALVGLARADWAGARRRVAEADEEAGGTSLLAAALRRFLAGDDHRPGVYDQPAAFQAFVRGGGNRALYDATAGALAQVYDAFGVRTLLDLGCGDGRAVVPALEDSAVEEVDLVEPSVELLGAAVRAVGELGVANRGHPLTAQAFLAGPGSDRHWDLAQSTFALHTLAPDDRDGVLRALAGRVAALVVVEFDVPVFADRGPEHAAYCVERYERGLAEYRDDGGLVAQGFLMPVLVGQFSPGLPRVTYEQPIARWVDAVVDAGFGEVHARPVCPYWWADAHAVVARR